MVNKKNHSPPQYVYSSFSVLRYLAKLVMLWGKGEKLMTGC